MLSPKNQLYMPLVTVITSTLNCPRQLQSTAHSIRYQDYPNIQWIIADGGSSSATLDVIRANRDIVDRFFTEADTGIYDAWNKACVYIMGDWVYFLGAGDVFAGPNVLRNLFSELYSKHLESTCKLFYGNVRLVTQGGNVRHIFNEIDLDSWAFARPALPAHQGVFHHASLFSSLPVFDQSLRVAGDSKFLLEVLSSFTIVYINQDVCLMDDTGSSNSWRNGFMIQAEIGYICNSLGIRVPFYIVWRAWLFRALAYCYHIFLPRPLIEVLRKVRFKTLVVSSS
jgi:glycosyltransferase involved in cell wall biosynthesis